MSGTTKSGPARLDRSGINRIIQVLTTLLIFGVVLFACAGRLDWREAWAFLVLYLLGIVANGLWTLRHNPEVINERGRLGRSAKSWDKLIVMIYTLLLLGTFVVAGLDARYGWSSVPLAAKLVGAIAFILSLAVVFWVMTANAFLSTVVRIQDERGHYVATTGPYGYVRHPMYAGMFLTFWGVPLLLGSWWALVPGSLNALVFVIRTALEDRALQVELPGYTDYVRKVRRRLIPGVW
jgi:protein-S-isoprenylcysteine O-methyltransferase Ste14